MHRMPSICWIHKGALRKSLKVLSCAPLSSLFTLSFHLQPPWSPWIVSSISSPQVFHWAMPEFLLPVLWPGNALKAVSWDNHKAHPICFSFSRLTVFGYLMSCVLKIFHIFFLFFSCFRQEGIFGLCYPILTGSRSLKRGMKIELLS